MERLELHERLAAITAGLTPARGVSKAQLDELRQLLAVELRESAVPVWRAAVSRSAAVAHDRIDWETVAPELRAEIERALDGAPPAAAEMGARVGTRVARRTLPFSSSAEPDSVPEWAAGRKVERTLGPFVDRDGRPVWFDIFAIVRQVSLVRAPSATPLLTLPLRGFAIGPATNYELPAGSAWILSRSLTTAAPAGGYSGIRIKKGRLRLSVKPSIAGLTLTIPSGTRVTLELELDPPAPAAPAPSPGKDAHASSVEAPKAATFVFTAAGGVLRAASDAALKVFGAGFALQRKPASASYEPSLNRVLLPFTVKPGDLAIAGTQSDLLNVRGTARVTLGAWALPVAVTAADPLGEASGAGALVLAASAGLRSKWRGLETSPGSPVDLGPLFLLAETDRVAIVANQATGAGASQALRMWEIPNAGHAEMQLRFERMRFRFESLAGQLDAVLVTSTLQAAVDRPVPASGQRFTLRSSDATTVLWDDATASHALGVATLSPPPGVEATALAMRNALLTVAPPTLLLFYGRLAGADQVEGGALALFFRLLHFLFTLPDPYATSQRTPARLAGTAPPTVSAAPAALVRSMVAWTKPSGPQLSFALLIPGGPQATALLAQPGAPTARASGTEVTFFSLAVPAPGANLDAAQLLNPQQAREEDRQALQRLRAIFERAAGPTRESVVLIDVSTNVDQFGVAWGLRRRDAAGVPSVPLQIDGLDVVSPGQNSRLFLLPQFQWEPLRNLPNPNILFFFPDRLASGDDGSATLFGSNTVRLVPIRPDRVLDNLVAEFNDRLRPQPVGARFTLPFGIEAAARLTPRIDVAPNTWAGFNVVRPRSVTAKFTGGLQLSVTAHSSVTGPTVMSPSLPGAAWQTRNGVDPATGAPNGFSVLRGDIANPGAEKFFNDEMGPGSPNAKVPVVRVDFAGYGASTFSQWFNPNAVASVSQVRFDVFVARTAYEVVQIASVLYPWAVPVVRTITLERRKEARVTRADSGWVATGPGIYRYPANDPAILPPPPPEWTPIETHPGVVGGAFNVRRIRETGRVITRVIGTETIELLEVRFDADMQIEGVTTGQIQGTDLVPSIDQIGFVQRSPKGHPLVPQHLAAIMADEGPMGGPVNCEIEIADSGQMMHVVRVDVAASQPLPAGVPEFAAAARGSLALPEDGATWSAVRRSATADEFEPVDPISGTPLLRQGRASNPPAASPFYRLSDPRDLLRESAPDFEFGLLQTSDGHQFLLPRPRIQQGATSITTTERSLLADAYARSTSAGLFPKRSSCFVGQVTNELQMVGGRYRLGPATTGSFDTIAGGVREIIDGDALAIRTRYAGSIRYTLDPALPKTWDVAVDAVTTSLDLGPFQDLMGVRHDYRIDAGQTAKLLNPEPIYAPFLDPVVDILEFLSKLLGIDNIFEVLAVQSSFKFQATAQYPIEGPGNDYIDFGAMKIKGKLQTGFGWSEKDHWFGFFKVDLGLKVVVLPPIFANGKVALSLKGTELTGQEVTIRVIWGAAVEAKLGPIGVSAEFNYGIEVIVVEGGTWQIGLLVQVVGKADVFIAKVTIKLELMAAIKRLPPPNEKVEAIGQAKFAAEVEICWFLTISVEYDIEYREELSI
jgi:hypothetical protein